MNFVALLLGLGIERLLTKFFHLREFRWLDPVFDRATARLANASPQIAILGVLMLTTAAVLPVAAVSFVLADTLSQVPYFLLAVMVLLFSLGPRDLKIEAADYCDAVIDGRDADVQRVARELLENDPPADPERHVAAVRRSVFVQANNRIFAVMFWFLVLGPTGAWLFRVLDLLRRRLAFQYLRHENRSATSSVEKAARSLHGILAWIRPGCSSWAMPSPAVTTGRSPPGETIDRNPTPVFTR